MRAQRVRAAESRIEKQAVKWTAEGAVKGFRERSDYERARIRVFCDVQAYVSCPGYDGISLRAQ